MSAMLVTYEDEYALYADGKLHTEGWDLTLDGLRGLIGEGTSVLELRQAETTELSEYLIAKGHWPVSLAEALRLLQMEVGG